MKPKVIRTCPNTKAGFSLLEMVISVAILLIVAAIAIPNLMSAVRTARLRGAGSDFVGLVQQARMRAVQDDRYYSVYLLVTGNLQQEFVDIYPQNVNGASGSGGKTISSASGQVDPVIELANEVTQQPQGSAPNTTNLKSLFLGSNPANVTPWDGTAATSPITFGPEGVPCTPKQVSGATVCDTRGGPTAYWLFFQDSSTQNWEAVTVTPAGRIQKWFYAGSAWASL
jgi:prepilin-type N-terminal cleavage/methylation domain-containing protein